MMRKRNPALLLPGLLLLALSMMAGPAGAQEDEKQDAHLLESVTVTAQKREENVQEVPLSIEVLDDVTLQEERAYEFMDLSGITPNLYMSTSGGSTTYSYAGIRGRISSGADVDPTLTVLVDGVPYDDFFTMTSNLLFDVERVEVLRGPQSTMYGLNSTAGIINIVTKKPGDTFRASASAELSAGDEWDGSWMATGSLSGPLVEGELAAGLSFMTESEGGYIKNQYTGDQYNDASKSGGRGSLVWTPSDAWNITLGLSYTHFEADHGFLMLPVDDDAARALGKDSREEWEQDIDWEGQSEVDTLGTSLSVNYQAGPVDVVSVTAYRNSDHEHDLDFDYTSDALKSGAMNNHMESFSQEFRVQSSADEDSPLEWLVGYFYYHLLRNEEMSQTWYAGTGWPGFYPAVDNRLEGDNHALFGQATYRVLDDKLGFTLGLRQEWTSRKMMDRLGYLGDLEVTDSQFLPKFAIDYRFTPKIMAYASVTQGWRTGGLYNMSYQTSDPDLVTYKKETSWTYEAGAKTRFLDDRLTINAAVFHTVYDDYQDIIWINAMETYLLNAEEVAMTGFELEVEARISEDLLLTGGLGYVHAEYQDFKDAAGTYDGNTVSTTPDYDLNVALKYSFLGGFYVRPEMRGIGTIYWDRANEESQAPYSVFNLRAGYAKDEWEIYAFGENLTNKYAFLRAGASSGQYYGAPITPFKAGMGVSWNF